VLMDEPLGALDKQLREHMQFEIKHLHEKLGITVVYVTHDQGEALTMSDRIAVFNDGRIQQLAPPSDLYERPENIFVASFIGENNVLPGTIEQLDGDRALVRLDGGGVIDATAVNIREKGQRTTVSIRPERVEFKPEMMSQGAHTIEAQVMEVIYMGDILRARLKVAGSDNFVMKMRNTIGQTRLDPGQVIRIGWHPQDARALDPI
jgi:putative spermidine/putrescine transport system ATP-binding protein